MPKVPAYRAAGFFLLRAPSLPASTVPGLFADQAGPTAALARTAATPLVSAALSVASADLAEAAAKDAGRPRVRSRLLRYVTRMSTRPTPFGLFAGVGSGTFGDHCAGRLTGPPSHRTSADLGWLLAVAEAAEAAAGLPALTLTTNPLVRFAGERALLRPADVHGNDDLRTVSVRATPVVRLALELATHGCAHDALVASLEQSFPDAGRARAESLVARLHELHLLVGDLRPSLRAARPERDLLDRLPASHPLRAGLRQVVELTERADRDPARFGELAAAQHALVPGHTGTTYRVDAALRTSPCVLPLGVGSAVAEAVGWLGRVLGPRPRPRHLLDLHAAFVQRYGRDALVGLLDLLSPDAGLDSPRSYGSPGPVQPVAAGHSEQPDRLTERLLPLLSEALREGSTTIDLSGDVLAGEPEVADAPPWAPGLDVAVQVAAASAEAMSRGDWTAVLNPGPFAAGGRTMGRFAELLDENTRQRLDGHLRAQERAEPEVVHADLNYLPVRGRTANVAITPSLREFEIAVNVPASVPREQVITLGDILVGVAGEHFALYSARLGRELRVHQGHLLNPKAAPDPCRFLLEASHDRWSVPSGFSWGALETAPFLPRVTRRRVVLRPMQWTVHVRDTFGPPGSEQAFLDAVHSWRSAWRVPPQVYLAHRDQRLLLDLRQPLSVAELRAEIQRENRNGGTWLTLHEVIPGFDELWLTDERGNGYFNEVVVPVELDGAAVTARHDARREPAALTIREECTHFLPGGEWLSMKLYAPFDSLDDIITRLWRELLPDAGAFTDRWFYLRYADPDPHLRLRLHTGGDPAPLLTASLAWARGLARRGLLRDLVLDTYTPELLRYGGERALAAAERVFHASSVSTARFVAEHRDALDLEPTVLAAFTIDAVHRHWGQDVEQRLAATARITADPADRYPPREHRAALTALLADTGHVLHSVFGEQRAALAEAASMARELAAAGELTTSPQLILDSLAHLQVNRVLGVGREQEARAHRLLGYALRALRHRPQRVR